MDAVKSLEFDKILERVADFAMSATAKSIILSWSPFNDFEVSKKLLKETSEADRLLYVHGVSPAFYIDNIKERLEASQKNAFLSNGDLLRVASLLKISSGLKHAVDKANDDTLEILPSYVSALYTDVKLADEISSAILSETEVADNASHGLKEIRRTIRNKNDKIKEVLRKFVTSEKYKKYLQDAIVTMRQNRYVIPVKAEHKGSIAGLIHDRSDTGATIYVEPFTVVELNNELKELYSREDLEIEAVLKGFSVRVSEIAERLLMNFDIISKTDAVFARAKYAKEIRAVEPEFNDCGRVSIKKGRHPLISKSEVVPVSVGFGKDFDVLLITGPNTGGKTVTLKLVGLFTMMAMSGIFIPAEYGSEISSFKNVYADIGDEQSIEQSLSTFSSHIKKVIKITASLSQNSLVLLDELGAGTDPAEGSALSEAVTDFILKSGAKAIITTHYGELKEFAYRRKGIENASMGFDPESLKPTFELFVGVAGASNALHVAKRLGMPDEILDNARGLIGKEKADFENALQNVEKSKKLASDELRLAKEIRLEAEKYRSEAEQDKRLIKIRLEKLEERMQKEAKKLLADYLDEADELIEEIKENVKRSDEESLFEARRLKKKLENMLLNDEIGKDKAYKPKPVRKKTADKSKPIETGDTVFIRALNTKGEVIAINSKKTECTVRAGMLTIKVKLEDAEQADD